MEQKKNKSTKDRLGDLKKLLDNDSQPTDNQPTKKVKSPKYSNESSYKGLQFDYDLSKEQLIFLNYYIPLNYNITSCCIQAGVSRQTYYKWLKESIGFKESLEALEQAYVDKAMETLSKAMDIGDTKAAIFILKTKGKDRGFGETLDITSNGEGFTTPTIQIIMPNKDELDTQD